MARRSAPATERWLRGPAIAGLVGSGVPAESAVGAERYYQARVRVCVWSTGVQGHFFGGGLSALRWRVGLAGILGLAVVLLLPVLTIRRVSPLGVELVLRPLGSLEAVLALGISTPRYPHGSLGDLRRARHCRCRRMVHCHEFELRPLRSARLVHGAPRRRRRVGFSLARRRPTTLVARCRRGAQASPMASWRRCGVRSWPGTSRICSTRTRTGPLSGGRWTRSAWSPYARAGPHAGHGCGAAEEIAERARQSNQVDLDRAWQDPAVAARVPARRATAIATRHELSR